MRPKRDSSAAVTWLGVPVTIPSSRWAVSPRLFERLAIASLVAFAAIIVTGGAVRLTGSGLGCPDWPSCYRHGLTAQLSFHPMVEFVNRCITVAVVVVAVLTFVAALLRVARRRDLVWLSAGLLVGIAGQIVLGGLVVLFKLNPYLVMAHFLFSMAIVGDAAVLVARARVPDDGAGRPLVPVLGRELNLLGNIVVLGVAVVITIGTAVTGAGPHAGDPTAGVRRIPVAFQEIAELHSTVAIFVVGLSLASVLAFRYARAPGQALRRAQWLLELVVLQGVLGYTQYFLHDNPVVVGFHLAGATAVFVAATWMWLSLHPPTARTMAGVELEDSERFSVRARPGNAASAPPDPDVHERVRASGGVTR
jgi:cytochrome c oxidase assembly protein subunit 15